FCLSHVQLLRWIDSDPLLIRPRSAEYFTGSEKSRPSLERVAGFVLTNPALERVLKMSATPAHRASTGERINTSETTGHLTKALGERGIRLTRQRRVILQVMDDAEQHLDVDQIFARAREIDPGAHLVTVYRTIE